MTNDVKKMADILLRQYRDVCSEPFHNLDDREFREKMFSNENCEKNDSNPMMGDIMITTDVKKMMTKISNNSALGPDGIPVVCFKNGGALVIDAIVDITRSSFDEQKVPVILKKAWIFPV